MKRRSLFALILAVLLLLPACGGDRGEAAQTPPPVQTDGASEPPETPDVPETETVEFTDALGQTFSLPRPQRVVALIGSFADIWCLAGGEDTLAATANDAWESFGMELGEEVTNLGSGMKPNVELVLAAQPDLVLASSISSSNLEMQETFAQAGIPAAYFDVASFEDYLALLEVCTRLTGRPENYERYGVAVKEQVDGALARREGTPTVLVIQASGRSCTVKGSEGNVLGEMLAAFGCVNVADRDGALLEDLSLEAIIQADPDYIFAVHHGTDTQQAQKNLEDTLLSNPAWGGLRAVREGRFYTMERRLYNLKPNALWGDAYEGLAEILYGG